MWVCGHLIDDLSKKEKKRKIFSYYFFRVGGVWGGAWGIVWVESIVVCQVSVVLSKYESNVIINPLR